MPKFRVCVQQFVEEVGSVLIDAPTAEEAAKAYNDDPGSFDVDWSDGDDINGQEAYCVQDRQRNTLWER